jgi:hypothetical protein
LQRARQAGVLSPNDFRAEEGWPVSCDLATVERLYAVAIEDHPGSAEFLARTAWLPELLTELDGPGKLDR